MIDENILNILKFDASKEYGISIINKETTSIELLKKISHEDAEYFINSMEKIAKYEYLEHKYNEVILNYKDFISFLSQRETEDSERSRRLAYIQINRLFLNFVNSWKIFIDFTEIFYKRHFGEKSEEFIELKKLTNKLFDDTFTYKFFSKLRNYSEHENYAIQAIKIDEKGSKEAFFIKQIFSNNDYFSKKHFEKYWKTFNTRFPVLPQCEEGIKLLQTIFDHHKGKNNIFNESPNESEEILSGLNDHKREYYLTEINNNFKKSRFQLIKTVPNKTALI